MRGILFLLFFSVLNFVSGQTSIEQIKEIDSTLKSIYLARVFPLEDFCVFANYEEDTIKSFIDIHSQNFYFFKTNTQDTIVVFSGKLCGGHELGVVTVFRFVKGKPQITLSHPGKMIDLKGNDLSVYKYPCCAEKVNIITSYSLLTGERLRRPYIFYSSDDYYEVINSASVENKRQFVISEETRIHFSAAVLENLSLPMCNGSFSNVIGTLYAGQEGKVITHGRNGWILVRLDSMPTSTGLCLNEYYQKLIGSDEYVLFGWVKSETLKFD